MSELSWAETVRRVHQRAENRCEYCQTARRVMGQAMHVEHIHPDGPDTLENLCLSCPSCNLSKAQATAALDPDTDETVPLFNPRLQSWSVHFAWIHNGQVLRGLTPTGRATIVRLRMNQPRIVEARSIWILAGIHPPHTS
jgi:5-methylcytosine-specific restriction endonuclease McrA